MPCQSVRGFTLTQHALERMAARSIGRSALEAALCAGRIERPDEATTLYIVTRRGFGPAGPTDVELAADGELVVVVMNDARIVTAYCRPRHLPRPAPRSQRHEAPVARAEKDSAV